MNDERPTKRARIEMEPVRYKRKAEVLDEPIELTPMEIDVRPPFIFFPMPRLIRCDANALEDEMDN